MLATGSVARNYERLFDLVDNLKPQLRSDLLRYAQRAAIGQQITDRTWHLLTREVGSELHQQLMSLDPNGKDARRKLADLAFEIGRLEDATELVMSDFEMRQHLLELLRARGMGNIGNRSKTTHLVETKPAGPIVCVTGWLVDADATPARFERLILDDEQYTVIGWLALDRPDVQDALSLPSHKGLGFVAFAQKGMPIGWRLRRRFLLGKDPSIKYRTATIWSKKSHFRRGHIDTVTHYDLIELDLPKDWDNYIEVELPVPAEFGIFGELCAIRLRQADLTKYEAFCIAYSGSGKSSGSSTSRQHSRAGSA